MSINKAKILSRLFFLGLIPAVFFAFSASAENATNEAVNELIEKALSENAEKTQVITNDIPAEAVADPAAEKSAPAEKSAAKTQDGFVNIESPKAGEVMVKSNAKIAGKTIPGVLVEITVNDEDLHKKFIRHMSPVRNTGTTTSDKNGDWVYVPQSNLEPGEYSTVASFKDQQKGSITSETIYFIISDSTGAVSVPLVSREGIYASVSAAAVILILVIVWEVVRHRRQKNNFSQLGFPDDGKEGVAEKSGKDRTMVKLLKRDLLGASKELRETIRDMSSLEEEIEKDGKSKAAARKMEMKNLREATRRVERELIDATNAVNDAVEEAVELEEGETGR